MAGNTTRDTIEEPLQNLGVETVWKAATRKTKGVARVEGRRK
jgi:hypothetical protein